MLWLLFGQRVGGTDFTDYALKLKSNINLIPFTTVRLFLKAASKTEGYYWVWQAERNIVGNVVLFVPLGIIPAIYPKIRGFIRFVAVVSLVICTVEILQFLSLLGSCDIDDLILNLAGASAGYAIMKLSGIVPSVMSE